MGDSLVRIEIEIFGEKQVARDLIRLGEHVDNPLPLWQELMRNISTIERQQFDSQGQFSGGWAKLAESTIAAKAAAGLDPRILHATLLLEKSLTSPGLAPSAIREVTPEGFRFGTSVPYAKYHQTGTRRMPRRRVLEFTPGTRRDIVKRIQRFVITGQLYPNA